MTTHLQNAVAAWLASLSEDATQMSKRIGILFARHMKAVVPDFTSEQRERYNKLSEERRAPRR
jgi:hypothetical protein